MGHTSFFDITVTLNNKNMPAWLAPLITGGASLIGGLINGGSQKATNEQEKQFALEMYERQKRDANDQWTKQNEYNSPQSQMSRLRDAGLNPNLVYGNGSAVNTASPISTPQQPKWSPTAPRYGDGVNGATGALASYFDVQMRQAQIDNLKTQNSVLQADQALKQSQRLNVDANTGLAANSLDFNKQSFFDRLLKLNYEKQFVGNNAIRTATDNEFNQANYFNGNRQKMYDLNMAKTVEDLAIKKGITVSTSLKNQIQSLELELNKRGINKTDPIYMRIIGGLLNNVAPNFKLWK